MLGKRRRKKNNSFEMRYSVFSILLVLADFYTFILVAFVYVYEKRSLIDYLPTPDEYDLA